MYKDGDPKEFLQLLNACDLVVANSFHGTALSINFKKPSKDSARWQGLFNEARNNADGGQHDKEEALLNADRERRDRKLAASSQR